MRWILFCGVLVCVVRVAELGVLHKSNTDTKTDTTTHRQEPETLPKHMCRPGTEWKSQCNDCHCTKDGRKRCTEKICDNNEQKEKERHCASLTSWRNDCNSCFCTETGQPICSKSPCTSVLEESTTEVPLHRGKDCAAGSKWKSQCNDCACTEDGLAFCTEKACLGFNEDVVMKCAPKSSWINDCNTCWCTDGRALCTKIGCGGPIVDLNLDDDEVKPSKNKEIEPESESIYHNIVKREACKPKTSFKKDCNFCKCSADGLSYHCSQNECMDTLDRDVEVFMESEGKDHIERHTVCEPHSSFQIRCNDCVCNHDGTDYTCTNSVCTVPEDVELFHELRTTSVKPVNPEEFHECEAKFSISCDTCTCGLNYCVCHRYSPKTTDIKEKIEKDQEYLDENKDLRQNTRVVTKKCIPDEVFELDCNMCRCSHDGLSYSCTRRACFNDTSDTLDYQIQSASTKRKTRAAPASAKETPKACTPGQEFRMDCNTCLCDNEGKDFSCTRIDCNNNNHSSRRRRDVTNQDIDQCTPGSVFERECNVCRCDDDGHHAMCTTHRCEKPNHGDKLEENNEVDTNFRCNAGEKFKRDCNDCTCSADGKSVFCTVNFCDKDIDNIKI